MNRLTKKCLIGSATLHGSLVGIVLVCSAFVGSKEEPKPNVIELVPFGGNFRVTDGPSHEGGTPPPVQAKAEPQPAPAPAPAPAAQPPPTREEKVEPIKKPEPRVEKVPVVKQTPKDDDAEPVRWKPRTPTVNLKAITRNSTTKTTKTKTRVQEDQSDSDSIAENNAKLRNKLAQNINGIADAIARRTADAVISDSIGDGTSGVASVNYRTVLFTRYYNAWISPDEVDDANATTDARVTIARDGTVISATIEKRSGNAAMDRSVERAIRSVRKLEAFPTAWKESERTFRIRFNLKSKLAIG